jgi:hypothetical protein
VAEEEMGSFSNKHMLALLNLMKMGDLYKRDTRTKLQVLLVMEAVLLKGSKCMIIQEQASRRLAMRECSMIKVEKWLRRN